MNSLASCERTLSTRCAISRGLMRKEPRANFSSLLKGSARADARQRDGQGAQARRGSGVSPRSALSRARAADDTHRIPRPVCA